MAYRGAVVESEATPQPFLHAGARQRRSLDVNKLIAVSQRLTERRAAEPPITPRQVFAQSFPAFAQNEHCNATSNP